MLSFLKRLLGKKEPAAEPMTKEEKEQQAAQCVMDMLRARGIPCYTAKDLITPELASKIKGSG